MNRNVMITCALTGAGDTVGRSEHVPVTPEQIAESGIAAARAGATIVHIHVRDPETGPGLAPGGAVPRGRRADPRSRRRRHRQHDRRHGRRPRSGSRTSPTTFVEGTDLVSGVDRLAHVEELLPDICTLDCGSLNFGEGSLVYVSTPDMLREGAKKIQELGVRAEMEIFDTGHLWFANKLVLEGLIDAPAMYQLCMGIPYGAPADPLTLAAMVNQVPDGAVWASFALGAMQMPWVAQSILLGRSRPRRAQGQPLPEPGCEGHQRPAGRAGAGPSWRAWARQVATPDEGREILALKAR